MSKRREQEHANQNEDIGRTLHRVYAALYNNVPWVAVAAICMYLPGIVLWAVFALHCKADTFKFLTTIAPVDDSTVDGVSNLVNTTLIALIITATFIFMLALVLAIARSLQKAGAAPNSSFPCVRNSPSSFYLYRVFNLGYNFIVFFVNLFIIFLMMGAFLWLVVAYGANLSIKGGVLDAANIGTRPQLQYDLAKQNYTTVVSTYERQLKVAPVCVRNSTWLKQINSSIGSILKPQATNANDTSLGVALLCPQTCLNLGSWATLFKLKSGCMCEQDKLFLLQKYSLAVATDAGVALGGLILIYFGSCCMHYYLITERVHAGYDYKRAKRQASRRQQLNSSVNGSDPNRNGPDKGGPGGSGGSFAGPGGSSGDAAGGLPDGMAEGGPGHHVIAMNGGVAQDGLDPSLGGALLQSAHGRHQHQRSNSGSSAYDSLARNLVDSQGGSFSVLQEGQQVQAGGMLVEAAAGAATAGALAAAAAGRAGMQPDGSPFMAASVNQQGQDAVLQQQQQQQRLQVLNRHHRVSSGGGSSSSPVSGVGRQLQRIPSPHNVSRSAAAAAAAAATGGAVYYTDSGHSYRGSGSRVADWQQQQQQQQQQHPLIANDHLRATSPPPLVGAWSAHGRSESRSSTSSIRDLLSGAVPLDNYGHVQRTGLTPTSSGNAAAAAATMQQLQQHQLRVPVIQEVPRIVPDGSSGVAAMPAAAPVASGSSSYTPAAAGTHATHRRGDSQQSNSSSSSYDTVVCHSPRSSDPDNSSNVSQAVLQVGGAAGAASATAFLCSGSVISRAQVPCQSSAVATADAEVPAAPIAVGSAVDGEEALNGSKTGSWSKKQAHRRLPALDFTTAAPALWLAQERQQQQQVTQAAAAEAAGPGTEGASGAAATAAAAAPPAASAATAAAAAKVMGRAPVRRHIALEDEDDLATAEDVSAVPQQQQHMQLQEELSLDQGISSAQQQQGQQQQQHGHLPSIEAVAAMLRPSPEPSEQEQRQQEVQAQMQGMRDIATLEAEQQQQQQRLRQRPPYSLLLPPPEQHELLLKQQQQQLQVLLQQAQEEQQQQQQQVWQQHQRQWSTSNISLAHSASTGGNSPSPALLRHHHSYSTPDAAAAAAAAAVGGSGLAASPYGSGSGIAVSTPSKYAPGFAGVPRASFGGFARTTSGGGVLGTSMQQQQGYMFPGSFSSSSAGGMRFAGSSSANGDDDSSPGEAGGSFSSRGFVPSTASAIAGGGAGAYGAPGSAAGGSVASSVFTTPQATPQSSPAPLRSGRATPSYGLNLGGASSSSAGGVSGLTGSSSWSQLPPTGHGSVLTTSSSYSGSANAPGFAGGLNGLLAPGGVGTPRSVMSPLGREEVLPLQGPGSGYGLLNPSSSGSGSGFGLLNPSSITPQGSGVPAITPIPEVTSAEGLEGEGLLGGPLGGDSSAAAAAAAAAAGSSMGQYHPQQQDVMESPLERRRSGYRSSMRKGLMAYDQYKHRHRYQDAVTQPLDPSSEVARRYRSRMPAI